MPTESCDVDGCTSPAIVDIVSRDEGLRCRGCMETDLGVKTVE